MQSFKRRVREQSHSTVISSRKIAIEPTPDDVRGLIVVGDGQHDAAALTHWSFGQLCSLASPGNSPASYFRDTNMPAPVIADCLNYNLRFTRGVEDVGILLTEDGHLSELRAVIWGADQYTEVRIRHTKGAPDRWLEEVTPVLREYSQASAKPVVQAVEDARHKDVEVNLDQFLANRFGKRMVAPIKAIHETEEGRPIETLWDVTVAATAHARSIKNTDARLEIERTAGALLKLAA
jgi:hypothetical protein